MSYAQLPLVDIGPRVAGAAEGMIVRELATDALCEIVEVATLDLPCARLCMFVGDVAVEVGGGYRVCGPEAYFWTLFEPANPS